MYSQIDQYVTEWQSQYVDIGVFEEIIHSVEQLKYAYEKQVYSASQCELIHTQIEHTFWEQAAADIQKVSSFFDVELKKATGHVQDIRFIVTQHLLEAQENLSIIESNIQETYRGLDLLNAFCTMNTSQLMSVARQWDALTNYQTREARDYMSQLLLDKRFANGSEIYKLKEKLEAALALLLNVSG